MVRSASKIITLFKINRYSENLEAFVQRLPEAKDYHEILALEEYQFKFPVSLSFCLAQLEPNKGGDVWKHPNLVIGFFAQYAFHSEVDSREAPKACPLRPFVQGEIENRMSMFGIGTRACCPAHHARSLWWTEGQSCAGPSSMATTHVSLKTYEGGVLVITHNVRIRLNHPPLIDLFWSMMMMYDPDVIVLKFLRAREWNAAA
ncbi:hypothetical protein H4Q26_000691 [Puccinia striiformis f. sp. tritici PST-130]|nr:hypothetical protein H4Q26_000691 [Puccinia striiformis f. sp. tritici PST-130]